MPPGHRPSQLVKKRVHRTAQQGDLPHLSASRAPRKRNARMRPWVLPPLQARNMWLFLVANFISWRARACQPPVFGLAAGYPDQLTLIMCVIAIELQLLLQKKEA